MPSFRNAKSQAKHALKQNLSIGTARHGHAKDNKVHSLGTQRSYTQALTHVTQWLQDNRLGDLKSLNQATALNYLEQRSQTVGQKTLDQERQAIQIYLQIKLPVIKSELEQAVKSRAYTDAQVSLIAQAQTAKHRLATQIALTAGLRAHELFTLRRKEEQAMSSHRVWLSNRFIGREGQIYTVIGKGGLIREVLIPTHLAQALESKRLSQPITVKDRTIKYTQHYAIGGGKDWSNSFSAASQRVLGWSHGAHGLRHSYAQIRMEELQQQGFHYESALQIVSQALGHFRAEITKVYLR
ncbi:MAG: site-specific integrase [Coxiellaceae bacterium]|nr:MAG: site-specific integrase [Coxiellaceae bacterium]